MTHYIINYLDKQSLLNHYVKRKSDEYIMFENKRYIITVNVYKKIFVEEMIFDRKINDYYFYFHHDCLSYYHSYYLMNEFVGILSKLEC